MHTLNANKVGVATDNLRTFSDINRTVYNGFELSANLRREKLLLFGGINTERRASTDATARPRRDHARATIRTGSASAIRFRRSAPRSRCRARISCRGSSS